jgi:hypothetical protein
MLGDHKLNVYGFGDWIGPALKGHEQPAKADEGEARENVPALDDI